MSNIEKIKLNGAVTAIRTEIQKRIRDLQEEIFSYLIDSNNRYCTLGQAITKAETLLKEMRELLDEMHKLDPPHR